MPTSARFNSIHIFRYRGPPSGVLFAERVSHKKCITNHLFLHRAAETPFDKAGYGLNCTTPWKEYVVFPQWSRLAMSLYVRESHCDSFLKAEYGDRRPNPRRFPLPVLTSHSQAVDLFVFLLADKLLPKCTSRSLSPSHRDIDLRSLSMGSHWKALTTLQCTLLEK